MTFLEHDQSAENSAPIGIFTFTMGPIFWRYTSSKTDVLFGGSVYESIYIKRPSIEISQDVSKSDITVEIDAYSSLAVMYREDYPFNVVNVKIQEIQENDVDEEALTLYIGRITDCNFLGGNVSRIKVESIFSSLNRITLKRLYQTTCPYYLYGPQCGVSKVDNEQQAILDSVSGVNLDSANIGEFEDGYFSGGIVEWLNDELVLGSRSIYSHTGSIIQINYPFSGLSSGNTIKVFPGCAHTVQVCADKFSNQENCGAFPYIPGKNPFGSDPIF